MSSIRKLLIQNNTDSPAISCCFNSKQANVLVGVNSNDNASVFKLNDQEALVQSIGTLPFITSDPYTYGKIAVSHSLSNIFAMGAEVKTALNFMGYPKCTYSQKVLDAIYQGGNEKLKECGALLMGNHTIQNSEIFYGVSATGTVHPQKIYRNNTAKIGHVLILTKPLGMGILTTAIKRDLIRSKEIDDAIKIMEILNYLPSQIMKEYEVSACTNISTRGLLGHALESTNAFTSYTIHCGVVPVAPLAQELADQGIYCEQTIENIAYIEPYLTIMCNTTKCKLMYCDTQISGGLLIAMDKNDAKEYIKKVEELTFGYAKVIGEVIPRGITPLIVY